MIKAWRVIELLKQVPKDSDVIAYEGEATGIIIRHDSETWFIEADENSEQEECIEGFEE